MSAAGGFAADGPGAGGAARVPEVAAAVFGPRLALARRYADLLTGPGIARGLLGPREAGRVWQRHLLNCAAVGDLLPAHARVVDVGSGAGLPGLALAVRRPDLHVDLVESLKRRCEFLTEAVDTLGLGGQVRVMRGRAEDDEVIAAVGSAGWVTARAVAPLDRLVRWCLPLLRRDGWLLALKGARAADELRGHAAAIGRSGGRDAQLTYCTVPGTPPVRVPVVLVRRGAGGQTRRGERR